MGSTKKVLLIVIDALTARVLVPAMDNGQLPHLQSLRNAGYFSPENISIFPSITHAALTSIATGRYPQTHGVLGCHWYQADQAEVAFFAADPEIILSKGITEFVKGFLVRLNHTYLRAQTLFQRVEQAGRRAASLNFLIFRGDVAYTIDVPFLLKLLPAMPEALTIHGPSTLYLGDFVQEIPLRLDDEQVRGGATNWFGFGDETTADLLVQLAGKQLFPDFTLAYFPHNDSLCHSIGPAKALDDLVEIDSYLGNILAAYGGLDAFLSDFCLIVTGDHSQSDIVADESLAAIDLDQILADFQRVPAGQSWTTGDEILICPNLRVAQLYLKATDAATRERVIRLLLDDTRIDQIFWVEPSAANPHAYRAVTGDRGALTFWRGPDGRQNGRDQFGNQWSWEGDLAAVGGVVVEGQLTFPDYPNAFERLAGVIDSPHSGQLWATARPGYEFTVPEASVHAGGGSHGSLHRLDSHTALFVAGAPARVNLPAQPRIVDIAGIVLAALGLPPLED
ncbi:MAG: alkaline phosphatase family protein [Caldilineaceae bacterium]